MLGKCIGAIIKNKNGDYLVQYRLKHPMGLALPAGHIEGSESSELCLEREILEETGLKIVSYKEVLHETFPNRCPKNHENHEWWVYEVLAEGEPVLRELDKHKFLRFMPADEMKQYVEKKEYDPAWFDHIFPALGVKF